MAAASSRTNKIYQKLTMSEYKIGEWYWVDITHIIHPHSFYVRPVVFREDLGYLQETHGQLQPGEVQKGKIIIYKSESLDLYVRGDILRVANVDGDIKCDIKAIDYGCEDNSVPFWKLCHPKNEIAIPPLATHCLLGDCKSLELGLWTEDTIEAMKSYVGNERARLTVKGRTLDQLVVELVNSCPNDIGTMLTLTGYTALGNPADFSGSLGNPQHNPPYEDGYFGCKLVKVGDVLHVRCQTGKDLSGFYVAEVNDFKQYRKHHNDFTDYCRYQKTPNANDLSIGRGVGFKGQFMMQYERSVVKEVICPTKVVIQKIDWGDTVEANINHLKLVKPMIFGQTTAVALYCRVSMNQEKHLVPSEFLYPGVEFLITINEVGQNFNTPHIVEISQLLTK